MTFFIKGSIVRCQVAAGCLEDGDLWKGGFTGKKGARAAEEALVAIHLWSVEGRRRDARLVKPQGGAMARMMVLMVLTQLGSGNYRRS